MDIFKTTVEYLNSIRVELKDDLDYSSTDEESRKSRHRHQESHSHSKSHSHSHSHSHTHKAPSTVITTVTDHKDRYRRRSRSRTTTTSSTLASGSTVTAARSDRDTRKLIDEYETEHENLTRRLDEMERRFDEAKRDGQRYKRRLKESQVERVKIAEENTRLRRALKGYKHALQEQKHYVEQGVQVTAALLEFDAQEASIQPQPQLIGAYESSDDDDATTKGLDYQPDHDHMDSFTDAEVTDIVTGLNTAILTLASTIAGLPAQRPASSDGIEDSKETVSCREDFDNYAGKLCRLILPDTVDVASNTAALELAVRAWEVHCVKKSLQVFLPGLPLQTSDLLSQMYDWLHVQGMNVILNYGDFTQLNYTEGPSVASKWRYLTRTSAREVRSNVPTNHPESNEDSDINNHNVRGLLHILQSAGVSIDPDNEASHELELSHVTDKFGQMIESINTLSDQLGALLHEKLADVDYEVLTVEGGAAFDPAWMVNGSPPRVQGEGGQKEGEHDASSGNDPLDLEHEKRKSVVACSVNLGLSVCYIHGEPRNVLVKPEVVLNQSG